MVIVHDDYNQYYVAVEQQLCMESTDVTTAVFFLLGSHYIFNLSYHPKVYEVLHFIQEKIAGIPSGENKYSKSAAALSHINGTANMHESLDSQDAEYETDDERDGDGAQEQN